MRIVYDAFEGRYADNPRALHEALLARGDDHEHLWLLDPRAAAGFPPGVATARYGSHEGRRALESADLVIANTHVDRAWSKRDRTFFLQTWHGTPLKRIHADVLWAPEGRLERLQDDIDRWDLLLSPNRPSTPLLRRAFRYDGEVLESGYPRNDVLLAPDREARRARVREQLEIPEGRRVVLYAPTWRDDEVFTAGGRSFALPFDVGAFVEQRGEDHVLLLRLHYMLKERLAGVADHPAVRDVCAWPDISDLYLAADVLVTDYSSTMFDFAVTGRPMLFYVYDLEDYAERLRGFYLDFAAEAPGPLLRTTQSVLDALGDLDAVAEEHAAALERFRARYTHLEDGRATERVLDAVLERVAARA